MDTQRQHLDVLVIGAGLIGAVIANQLANEGRRVAVVDAQSIAGGATRRAVGLATPRLSGEHIADTMRGVDAITNLALRHGVTPRSCRVLHLASKPADADTLRSLYETLGGQLKMSWEIAPDLVPQGFGGGLMVHHSVLLDPVLLTTKLLQHARIVVQPNVEVQSLEWAQGRMNALANNYTIPSNVIILATNAYAGLLSPYLADAVHVVRGVTWLSRPLDRETALRERVLRVVPTPLVIDRAHLLVTETLDGRLRINAWHWNTQTTHDPTEDVQRFLRAHLPEALDYTEAWLSGVTTVTQDGAPLVGRLVGEGKVLYALGAGMYGPAWATVIAERIADLLDE